MPSLQRPSPRTFIVPLLIIAVAIALWGWGSRQQSEHSDEVHRFVEQLCDDAAANAQSPTLASANTPVGRAALSQLRTVLRTHEDAAQPIRIEVVRGDVSEFADGIATHTVMLSLENDTILGLRIAHPGDPSLIEIIGLWTP